MLGGGFLYKEKHWVEKRGVPSLCNFQLEGRKLWCKFGD